MKIVTSVLDAILTGTTNYRMADLWTFTLKNGTILRYTDADIDLSPVDTFARASIANYLDLDGILQQAAVDELRFYYDYVKYDINEVRVIKPFKNKWSSPEDFRNTATAGQVMPWVYTRASCSANMAYAPDGTLTADKIIEDTTASNNHYLDRVFPAITGMVSVYLKAEERSKFCLFDTVAGKAVGYDLVTGTTSQVGVTSLPSSYGMEDVGGGWYRCYMNLTSCSDVRMYLLSAFSGTGYSGDGTSGLYIWGAQVELGTAITPYGTESSTVIELYGRLLESQATNLCLYSEDFRNTATAGETRPWAYARATVSTDAATAPDGTLTADKLVEDSTASSSHFIQQNVTVSAGYVVATAFFKEAQSSPERLVLLRLLGLSSDVGVSFNIRTMDMRLVYTTNLVSYGIEDIGNGWRRAYIVGAVATGGTLSLQIRLLTSTWTQTYSGDGSSGIYLWGAQLEEASTKTSYIKTVASPVTRAADVITYRTFQCDDVLCKGAGVNWTTGLDVGEDEVEMYFSPTSVVGSLPFKNAVEYGLFDRATVLRERSFMTTWGDTTPGTVVLFTGEVTDADATRNTAILKCKDMRNLLNVNMNARQYQPTCTFVFGDSNCAYARASLTESSSVMTGSSGSIINCALTNAAGYFNNGVLTFTDGLNVGLSRSVKYWSPGVVQLVAPFPSPLVIGDNFTITPGCTKNYAGATQAFTASAITGSTPNKVYSLLTNAPGYFNGGTLQFTSGANVGQSRTVSSWSGGIATLSSPFSNSPAVGDSFIITAVSTNTVGSCSGYSNTAKFGGMRFIPVAETSY